MAWAMALEKMSALEETDGVPGYDRDAAERLTHESLDQRGESHENFMPGCKKPNDDDVYMSMVNLMEKVLDFVQLSGLSCAELRTFSFEVAL